MPITDRDTSWHRDAYFNTTNFLCRRRGISHVLLGTTNLRIFRTHIHTTRTHIGEEYTWDGDGQVYIYECCVCERHNFRILILTGCLRELSYFDSVSCRTLEGRGGECQPGSRYIKKKSREIAKRRKHTKRGTWTMYDVELSSALFYRVEFSLVCAYYF